MKKLEEMSHKELIEFFIFDENIYDNINVSNDYEEDKHGNSVITMSIPDVTSGRKKGVDGLLILNFNRKGRLIGVEIATHKKGEKNWQVASATDFVDFTPRYGDDKMNSAVTRNKRGN